MAESEPANSTPPPKPASKKAKSASQAKSAGANKPTSQKKTVARSESSTQVVSGEVDVDKAIDLELEELAEAVMEGDIEGMIDAMQSSPELALKPSELRSTLADRPELLGAGLCVMTGKQRGVRFPTDVGEIDLLLVDESGSLLVVSIPEQDSASDPVSDVLQRIGWVRKHIANADQGVQGIVLLPPMPEELGYAAAAVAGTVTFRTYRMSIAFEDLEL